MMTEFDDCALAEMTTEIVEGLRRDDSVGSGVTYRLTFRIEGRLVPATMKIPSRFPAKLPVINIEREGDLAEVPHVPTTGPLCYLDSEGFSASLQDPSSVIAHALHKAHEVIAEGLSGANRSDIVEELDAYWMNHVDSRRHCAALVPTDRAKVLRTWVDDAGLRLVADSARGRIQPLIDRLGEGATVTRDGLYLPLSGERFSRSFVTDLATGRISATRLIEMLDPESKQIVHARLKQGLRPKYFVLGVATRDHGRALIGLQTTINDRRKSPVKPESTGFRIVRVDADALLPRAGAEAKSWVRRAIVIGCGALGGHVATGLARMGIQELTLVDPEELEPENVYRHTLGFEDVGYGKAASLAAKLVLDLPHVETRALVDHAERLQDDVFGAAELVVVTVGTPTLHRMINRRLVGQPCRVVFGWLEPLGIGGHALLLASKGKGCLECLFVADDGSERLTPKSDFAGPGQAFARRLAGCGSFTPFADLDARRTANVVLELVAEALTEREGPGRLLSWRGSPRRFSSEGFELSHFYHLSDDERNRFGRDYRHTRCPLCARSTWV